MEYVHYLLKILGTSGKEIGAFFQATWSYSQYSAGAIGIFLLLMRKVQIFVLYAFGFYYFWGFSKVINTMNFESPQSWIRFLTYLVFGLVVFFTLCYFFFLKPKELKN